MSKFRYLVLGSGVGRAIAAWLIRQHDTAEIVIADTDYARALNATDIARGSAGDKTWNPPCSAQRLDIIEAQEALPDFFSEFAVVVSAVPAGLNPLLARAAIKAGTHFCDLGGVVPVTRRMLLDNGAAEQAGVSVITDNGLMPGLGNIMAMHLAVSFDRPADTILIHSGSLPLKPERKHHNYQQMYSAPGTRHIAYDEVPVLTNGQIIYLNPTQTFAKTPVPFTLHDIVPGHPDMEIFISAGAGLAPWHLQKLGVRNFGEYTYRWKGFQTLVLDTPEDLFEEVFSRLPVTDATHPDVMYLKVGAESDDGDYKAYELVDTFRFDSGLSAIGRCTGFPAALMAQWLAQGRIPPGARTAELAFANEKERGDYLKEIGGWLSWTTTD